MRRIAVCLALLLAGVSLSAQAQSLTRGTLSGTVRDSLDVPLHDVRVALQSTTSGAGHALQTGRDGRYSFPLLRAGSYTLQVEGIGYRPLTVRGIEVRPGELVRLPLTLAGVAPPVTQADTVDSASGRLTASAGALRHFAELEMRGLPEQRRELTELARMAGVTADRFEMEGLPARFGGMWIDGLRVQASPWFSGWGAPLSAAAFPLAAFERAILLAGDPEIERAGAAGATLHALSRSGAARFGVEAFGTFSRGEMATAAAVEPASGSFDGLQGGLVVGGPLASDAASFVAGVEMWSLDSPPGLWAGADSLSASIAAIARDSFDLAVDDGIAPLRTEVVSFFGGLEWQLSPAHALSIATNGAVLEGAATPGSFQRPYGGAPGEGRDLLARATLVSQLRPHLVQELRLGFQHDLRESPDLLDGTPYHARILASDIAFGADRRESGRFAHSLAQAGATWHVDLGAHRPKAGMTVALASYDRELPAASFGEFQFATLEDFARGDGSFQQTLVPSAETSFDVPRLGLFAQDRWTAAPGLELTFGLRYDLELLPIDDVTPNQEWWAKTGLLNTEVPSRVGTLSPRAGFVWSLGERRRWVLHGAAGVYAGQADAALLGSLLGDAGRLAVRRGVGTMEEWPNVPGAADPSSAHPTLTLLARGFGGARTVRTNAGLSRLLGAGTVLRLDAAYRRTDGLPRAADLNLSPLPSTFDQFGRPVFGSLRQDGGLLQAEPGSNRRFGDFDVVTSVNVDGWSEYRALTLGLERQAAGWLSLFASYTYSRTTDNLLAPVEFPGAEFDPRITEGWAEGTSDLDVPHRITSGFALDFGPATLSGLYRYRSGTPFTPGFAAGVDANGDGVAGNDPAFISESVEGTAELLTQWDCLQTRLESFAERNACRSDGAHSLDARVAIELPRFGRNDTELFLDGLNLVDSGYAVPDRALYRLDPEGTLTTAADGSVAVPLVANPNFGTPLARFRPGRQYRIGLRIAL